MDKMLKQRISWKDFLLSLIVSFVAVLLPRMMIDCVYPINDDLAMIRIGNGSFSGAPDGHAIFMQYPLTWLIARFNALFPGPDWYLAVMLAVYIISAAAVLYRLLRCRTDRGIWDRLLISLGFVAAFYSIWLGRLCQITFTTVGAFSAGALILVYALQPKELDHQPANLGLALLLFCFTYTVRIVFCGMALPFLGIIWLWKRWRELPKLSSWTVPLCAGLCAVVMFGMNVLAYSSPEWKSFLTYNDQRSYLEDYGNFPDYEEHEEFITSLGLTREEYAAIQDMDYTIIDEYSPDITEQLYNYAAELETSVSLKRQLKNTLRRGIRYYFNLGGRESWTLLTVQSILLPLCLLIAALFVSIKGRSARFLVFPLLNLACEAVIWLYIGYCNRGPARVLYSLRIVVGMAALAGIFLLAKEKKDCEPTSAVRTGKRVCAVLLVAVLCVSAVSRVQVVSALCEKSAQNQNSQAAFCDYVAEHPDSVYVIDTRSVKGIDSIYIPVNLIYSGGWTIYSPMYQQKLERNGLSAMNRETLLRENVYLALNKKRNINSVLGLPEQTQVEADIIEEFGSLRVYSIHSIVENEG